MRYALGVRYAFYGFIFGAIPNLIFGFDTALIGGLISAAVGAIIAMSSDDGPSSPSGGHDLWYGDYTDD